MPSATAIIDMSDVSLATLQIIAANFATAVTTTRRFLRLASVCRSNVPGHRNKRETNTERRESTNVTVAAKLLDVARVNR